MKKDLPIFDIIINEEDLSQGVGRISLVDEPAIGVDWIALKKQPKSILAKRVKKQKVVLAKRECLGCPPNGDGTKANGEPDRRCKDTGGEGGAVGKGGAKIPKGPVDAKAKELKDAEKVAEKASQKIADASFENPPTSTDYAAQNLPKEVANAQFWRDFHSRGLANNSELKVAEDKLERAKGGLRDKSYAWKEDIEKANTSYNDIVEKEISKLPNPYDAKPSYVNRDNTWDHKNGMPTEPPFKGAKRTINYERRSSEDVLNGYPQYKIYVDWE